MSSLSRVYVLNYVKIQLKAMKVVLQLLNHSDNNLKIYPRNNKINNKNKNQRW